MLEVGSSVDLANPTVVFEHDTLTYFAVEGKRMQFSTQILTASSGFFRDLFDSPGISGHDEGTAARPIEVLNVSSFHFGNILLFLGGFLEYVLLHSAQGQRH
ncbi:hypothetical protein K474DRAFT_1714175 [Panus rudis PR-1116 ss-1]|nr:hypothetical protein K474DRAFT_1714175 [Panus rudis PR-1116 ss-1]